MISSDKNHIYHANMMGDGFGDGKKVNVLDVSGMIQNINLDFNYIQNYLHDFIQSYVSLRNPHNFFYSKAILNSTESMLNINEIENRFKNMVFAPKMIPSLNNNFRYKSNLIFSSKEIIILKKFITLSVIRSPVFALYLTKKVNNQIDNNYIIENDNLIYNFIKGYNIHLVSLFWEIYSKLFEEDMLIAEINKINTNSENFLGEMYAFHLDFNRLGMSQAIIRLVSQEQQLKMKEFIYISLGKKHSFLVVPLKYKDDKQLIDLILKLYNEDVFNKIQALFSMKDLVIGELNDSTYKKIIYSYDLNNKSQLINNIITRIKYLPVDNYTKIVEKWSDIKHKISH